MKHIYFTTLLLLLTIIGFAQERDHNLIRARIISKEEMTITGSFSFTLEVLAYDTCTLDSIRIVNDGTFLNISFNGSLSKSQNISQPSFSLKYLLPGQTSTCIINITHATNNLLYYPEDMGFLICLHEQNYNTKSYAGGKVYFTPYNSVEIWDKKDFSKLPRVWASKKNPAPARVFIHRDSIPVSTKPSNLEIQYDWQKYYQVKHVSGLPYLIQNADNSTITVNIGDNEQIRTFLIEFQKQLAELPIEILNTLQKNLDLENEIKVGANYYLTVIAALSTMGNNGVMWGITITNLTKEIRYFNQPYFKVSPKFELEPGLEHDTFMMFPIEKVTFPIRLEYGQVLSLTFEINPNAFAMFEKNATPDSFIQAFGGTTVGEIYSSNEYKLDKLVSDYKSIMKVR